MYYVFKLTVADDTTLLNNLQPNNIAYSTTKRNMVTKQKNGLLKEVGVSNLSSNPILLNDVYAGLDTNIRFSTDDYDPHPGDILISRNGEFIPHDIFADNNQFDGEITFKRLVFYDGNVSVDGMIVTKDEHGEMQFRSPIITSDGDDKGISVVNNKFRVTVGKLSLDTEFLNDLNISLNNYKSNLHYENVITDTINIDNEDDSIYINTKFTKLNVGLDIKDNTSRIITIFSDESTEITFNSSSVELYTTKGLARDKQPILTAKKHVMYFDGVNKCIYIINEEDLATAATLGNPTLNRPGIVNTEKTELLYDKINLSNVNNEPDVVTPYLFKQNIKRLIYNLNKLFDNLNIKELKDIGKEQFRGVVQYNNGRLEDSKDTISNLEKEVVTNDNDLVESEDSFKRSFVGYSNPENIRLDKGDEEFSTTSTSIIEITGKLKQGDELGLKLESIKEYDNNIKTIIHNNINTDNKSSDHIIIIGDNLLISDMDYYSKITIHNINNNSFLKVDIETKLSNGSRFLNTIEIEYFSITDVAVIKYKNNLISKDVENTIYLITNLHNNNTFVKKKKYKLSNSHNNNVFYDYKTKEFKEKTNSQVLLTKINEILTHKEKVDMDLSFNNNYEVISKSIKNVILYSPTANVIQKSNIYKFFSTNNELNIKIDGEYNLELFSSPIGTSDHIIPTVDHKFNVLDDNNEEVFNKVYGNIGKQTITNQVPGTPVTTTVDVKVPTGWTCIKTKSTSTSSDNNELLSGDVSKSSVFWLDKPTLGEEFSTYNNDSKDSNPRDASVIILDDQLRPYKLLAVRNNDSKGILESGWETNVLVNGTFKDVFIPMYTNSNGDYYFHIGGKDYVGIDHNAEIYSKVTYLKSPFNDLILADHIYRESTEVVTDHKPIKPVVGDTDIVYRTDTTTKTVPGPLKTEYQVITSDLGYKVLDYDELHYFPNFNTNSAYNVMLSNKNNHIKVRILDDKLDVCEAFLNENGIFSNFESISIVNGEKLVYCAVLSCEEKSFKNDDLVIAYQVEDPNGINILRYKKYVRDIDYIELSNENTLVFKETPEISLNDHFESNIEMIRSSINHDSLIKTMYVRGYNIYLLHTNGFLTKFKVTDKGTNLLLQPILTGPHGVFIDYNRNLFVDSYEEYYVKHETNNTFTAMALSDNSTRRINTAIESEKGLYEFEGEIFSTGSSSPLIYSSIKDDVLRSEIENNLYKIYKLKNNIYVIVLLNGNVKMISNIKVTSLNTQFIKDNEFNNKVLSTGNNNKQISNITKNDDLKKNIILFNKTKEYYINNRFSLSYVNDTDVLIKSDGKEFTFTMKGNMFFNNDIDILIHDNLLYMLYNNAINSIDVDGNITRLETSNNLIALLEYNNTICFLQNNENEILIKDLNNTILKEIKSKNVFYKLMNKFMLNDKTYYLFNDGSLLLSYKNKLIYSEICINPNDNIELINDRLHLVRDGYIYDYNNELDHFIRGEHVNLNSMLINDTLILEIVNDNIYLNKNKHVNFSILKVKNDKIMVNDQISHILYKGDYIFMLNQQDLDNPIIKYIYKRLNLKLDYGLTIVNNKINLAFSEHTLIDLEYLRSRSLESN